MLTLYYNGFEESDLGSKSAINVVKKWLPQKNTCNSASVFKT